MDDKNRFEDLFEQIAALLRFIKSKEGIPIDASRITPAVKDKLAKIHRDVEEFKRLGERVVELSLVSREEIDKRLAGESEEITPWDMRMLNQGKALKATVEELQRSFGFDVAPAPEVKPPKVAEVDDKTFRKRRRRKLKRMDGDQV